MTLMTRGAASVDQRSQTQTEAAVAMVRMRRELEHAITIVSLSANQITFRHPDLTGDNQVDLVTYNWSGVAGSPLTRQINSGPADPLVDVCQSFTVSAATPTIRLTVGTRYGLRLEFYENGGQAVAKLLWSRPGLSKQVVPNSCLLPAFTEASAITLANGLTGQYYNNIDFTNFKGARTDSTVNFDWGSGAPLLNISSDTFSVRWTGQIRPATTADYTFYVVSDDGARLWVDNKLVINNWTDHSATENSGTSTGVGLVELHLEAGPAENRARLDGAVRLLNLPGYGS